MIGKYLNGFNALITNDREIKHFEWEFKKRTNKKDNKVMLDGSPL